jgi:23S rRNA pseudouridine1911/1915/1917 synthase
MPSVSEPQVYHVAEADADSTLPALLRQWRPELSWGAAKQLLKSRQVSVNGATCLDEGRRVKAGDVVHIHPHPRTPQPTAEDVRIIYWDEDVVVVEKPALMTTLRHAEERNWSAARKNLQPTLDEVLPQLLQRAESGGDRREEPAARGKPAKGKPQIRGWQRGRREQRRQQRLPVVRAVHRLDRDTSGIMVFARTPEAERGLIEQFKVHSIERRYRAVVHGHPAAQTITTRLIRDRGDGLRGVTDSPTEGEDAVTHVRPLEDLGDYSLIECRLETGRTHQIRLHLSSLGHLVCGDPLYTRRLAGPLIPDDSGAPRLALHAARLEFVHPRYNERMDFDSPLPPDLDRFVRRLRRDSIA